MSDILCVTNRALCKEDFLVRVERIAAARPGGMILREKDLPEEEYKALARQVLRICKEHQVPCILHTFADAAVELEADALHVPLPVLRELTAAQKGRFTILGASCHSVEDALEAQRLGCTYITAGHIFDTGCKKGLPGRGLDFLKAVCESVSLPVYAIGGISGENIAAVRGAGARGACVMSGLMQCPDVENYLKSFGGENGVEQRQPAFICGDGPGVGRPTDAAGADRGRAAGRRDHGPAAGKGAGGRGIRGRSDPGPGALSPLPCAPDYQR